MINKEYNPNRVWTFEEKERAEELKRFIVLEQNGVCATCGKPLDGLIDAAHIIPKTKAYIKKYGWSIINHRYNLKATHRNANCNDAVMINPASRPIDADKLIQKIREDLLETNY